MLSKCNKKLVKNRHKSENRRDMYLWIFATIFVAISFILLSMTSFFCSQGMAEDQVHLGLVARWNNYYGNFYAVKIWDHYVYCITEQGIVIYDTTERITANFFTLEGCINLEVDEDDKGMLVLYVAQGHKGLLVLNMDKHQNVHYIAQYDTPGYAMGVAILGDYAYVADGKSGLQIIDISDKNGPKLAGRCDTPGCANGVAVLGDYAYVADWENGLQIIDISDKNGPWLAGKCDTPGVARGVTILGDYAYVADRGSGLQIIDISDKNGPKLAGSCAIPGLVEGLPVLGDYAYMANGDGLQIIDISDKNGPWLAGKCDTPGDARGVTILGDYAYVADRGSGLQIIDISDKNGPWLAGKCDTPGDANGVAVLGDYAYVSDWENGLQIIDISDKNGPKLAGSCAIPGFVRGVAVLGDYAYMANGDGLQIIDISDKNGPKLAGSFNTTGHAEGVAILGDYAYVADGESGLQIIDISDKNGPKLASKCDTPGVADGVAVLGDYAYVGDRERGLQIIDISDKNGPKLAGRCAIPVFSRGVAVLGDYAYVADWYNGLQVIDISDKNRPWFAGSYDTPGYAQVVAVLGDYAYVAAGDLQVIDISDKNRLLLAGSHDRPSCTSGVAVLGDYAYVAEGDEGLLVFEINMGSSSKGNLILVAGGSADSENRLWPATQAQANYVFTTFIKAGYEVYDIWYQGPIFLTNVFHSSNDQLVVDDSTPTTARLKLAINPWEAPETEVKFKQWEKDMGANTGPLYIYLIGHGAEDSFQIMPGAIINAKELKHCIDRFQNGYEDDEGIHHPGTGRQVVVIIESASSGSFIDELKRDGITVITAAGDGPCYSKPDYQTDEEQGPTRYDSFTTAFLDANNPNSFLDPNVANNDPALLGAALKDSFCAAREKLLEWGREGAPFHNQAPQMALPESQYTSLHFSLDGQKAVDYQFLDNTTPLTLRIIGKTLNGEYTPIANNDMLIYHSALNDPNAFDIQPLASIPGGVTNQWEVIPKKNGLFTLLAYVDPNKGGDLLLTAKCTIEVSDPSVGCGMDKMAVIVAGYQGSGDYLWESTNNMANHAYKTLRAMGYAAREIYYYNPYLVQELDSTIPGYEIRGYPQAGLFDPNITTTPFEILSQCSVDELLIYCVDHGGRNTFYLNPTEMLEAVKLIRLVNALSDKVNEKIIFIYDACYAGSFLNMINVAMAGNTDLSQKLIAITSTDSDQKAYFLNQGIVSFSYPFFEEWFLTGSLTDAFTYAEQFLPLKGQTPRMTDPNKVIAWDRDNTYYVDEARPTIIIDYENTFRKKDYLKITANVYSLSGTGRVWAVVEGVQSSKMPAVGGAITEAPEFDLFPDTNALSHDPSYPYGGTYTLETQDPCPNETNYIITIYAEDNSTVPKVASCKVPFGSAVENKTKAFIIAGADERFPGESEDERKRRWAQLERAESILRKKGLDEDDIVIITDTNTISAIDPNSTTSDHTLFLYFIGQVWMEDEGPYFYFNTQERLCPEEIYTSFPFDPNQRLLILMDTPYARTFLKELEECFPSGWSDKWAGVAGTDQDRLFFNLAASVDIYRNDPFPCFSSFFFSRILSGATVGQAYQITEDIVSLTRQGPKLILPEGAAYTRTAINRHLNYYLGCGPSAGQGEEYPLIDTCTAKVIIQNNQPHYTLTLTPHLEADITRAWVILTASSGLYQTSRIVDLQEDCNDTTEDGESFCTYHKDHKDEVCAQEYYRAFFMVEGRYNEDKGGDKDWHEWKEAYIKDLSLEQNTPIPEDAPDDPNTVLFHPQCRLIVNGAPTRHTFYCEQEGILECNDRDCFSFYAVGGRSYEIYAQELSDHYFIQLTLYDPNKRIVTFRNQPLSDDNMLHFVPNYSGTYYFCAHLASSYPSKEVEYIVWVVDPTAGEYTWLLVHVIDQGEVRGHRVRAQLDDKVYIPKAYYEPPDYYYEFNRLTPYERVSLFVYEKYTGALLRTVTKDLLPHCLNEKVITLSGASDPNALSLEEIHFPYFDANDSDGDGVSDLDEGEAHFANGRVANIPMMPYDPINLKKMVLFLEDQGNAQFREVRFIESCFFTLPDWLQRNYSFPYEVVAFRIEAMNLTDEVPLRIINDAGFAASLKAYVQMDKDQWEDIDIERVDKNTILLSLGDSRAGDGDRERNDIIDTRLALVCPHPINPLESEAIDLQGAGCFVSALMSRRYEP